MRLKRNRPGSEGDQRPLSSNHRLKSDGRDGRSAARPLFGSGRLNKNPEHLDASVEVLIGMLDFHALVESKRILDVNAKVANGALELVMTKQDLHGVEVAGLLGE